MPWRVHMGISCPADGSSKNPIIDDRLGGVIDLLIVATITVYMWQISGVLDPLVRLVCNFGVLSVGDGGL